MLPPLPTGMSPSVTSQQGIDDHETLVRALMVDRYGPEAEGGEAGKLERRADPARHGVAGAEPGLCASGRGGGGATDCEKPATGATLMAQARPPLFYLADGAFPLQAAPFQLSQRCGSLAGGPGADISDLDHAQYCRRGDADPECAGRGAYNAQFGRSALQGLLPRRSGRDGA